VLLGFKYLKHPMSLLIDVKKHEDVPVLVATVDVADMTTLLTKDGKILTRVLLSMRNNMKQFLRAELPPSSELWSTFVAGKPVKPGRDEDGRILVPLEKSMSGSSENFLVEMIYLTKGKPLGNKGRYGIELCKLDLPVTHLQWSLYLPEKYRFRDFEGNVDEWPGAFEPVTEAVPEQAYAILEQAQVQMNVANEDLQLEMQQSLAPQAFSKGVLPVKMSIPEKGTLERFIKLLVIDESAEVSFRYRLPLKYR